ncbi:hypothetical protein WJX72_002565 [[Myrmecia] bisecta]|uniref:RecA family profile 1 domain-containing protein n=1 Tax=[Myrmecia] bisecta TaxID=41462 RepID=A0AAW1PVT4_9CHLO
MRLDSLNLPLETAEVEELARHYPSVEHFCSRLDDPAFPTDDKQQTRKQQALGVLHQHILTHVAPPVQSGLSLFAHLRDDVRLLPTGCTSLDGLLRGGLREGTMTELVGESASGKTQLCIMAAVATAMRGEHVVYLDTSASFTARRAAAMYDHAARQEAAPESLGDTLAHITVQRVHNIHALLSALDTWAAYLQAEQGNQPPKRPSLLVVDSASALVSPILGGGQHSQGHALMICLARFLKHMAAYHRLAVLSTNHVVGGGGAGWGSKPEGSGSARSSETRPALGESWRSQPHVRVQLACGEGAARSATLKASALSACEHSVWFELCEAGGVALEPG